MATTNDTNIATETTTSTKLTEKQQSAIDKALARAKAMAAAKAGGAAAAAPTSDGDKAEKPANVKKDKKAPAAKKATPDPKAAKAAAGELKAAREAKRAADKAIRDAARAASAEAREEKKAAAMASKPMAHVGKVDKAGARLPALDAAGQEAFDLITGVKMGEGQMATLVAHLAHFNRRQATLRSLSTKLTEGQMVTVISSDRDPRLIGRTGKVTQVRKIRVLVDLGGRRDAYLFLSDVAPVSKPAANTLEEVPPTAEETVAPPTTQEAAEDEGAPQFLTPESDEEATPAATGTDTE